MGEHRPQYDHILSVRPESVTLRALEQQSRRLRHEQRVGQVVAAAAAVSGGATIPQNAIVMWSGTLGNIPGGWALCDGTNGTPDLRDRFILSVGAGEDPGATGGASTHQHASTGSHAHSSAGSHAHSSAGSHGHSSAGSHAHSATGGHTLNNHESLFVQGGSGATALTTSTHSSVAAHSHPSTGSHSHPSTGSHSHPSTGSHSHPSTGSHQHASTSNDPSFFKLAFIMKL